MNNFLNQEFRDNPKLTIDISTMSEIVGVHQRTLRIYDAQGLLIPIRSIKNRRRYKLDDIEKAKLILFLTRNLAINLSGVKIILSILKDKQIKTKDYFTYINKIAKMASINEEAQVANIIKTSKRGRKPKSA